MSELDLYRAKRDFRVTKEPRGRIVGAKGRALRFVVQRHDARRLHYDLRLELGGVYKSWAVTKVPSLDPAVKRLAVEVEDHPIDYGIFEGTIPKGEYGGGTVQLWDRGRWRPQSPRPPSEDLKKGHLKFELEGERITGRWMLIRLREKNGRPGRKQRHNWLLIKERDEAAMPGEPDALSAADTSIKTGRTLEEIALGARPKAKRKKATSAHTRKRTRRRKRQAVR
ncbi:MAG: DNA polymerase ligase N-terminal domain-containing protein [Alphaproteobacteria bacterium]